MKIYRAEIHGHLVEARVGDWGGEKVLLDGRVISDQPMAAWRRASHFFEIEDGDGERRRVEVRRFDVSRFGLGKDRIVISVDGVERCRLKPLDPSVGVATCSNCGYSLQGLKPEAGEVRCPECGRHASAAVIGLDDEENAGA